MRTSTVGALALAFGGSVSADILNYIDPLIGTRNGGHVFAGASLPFGMVKAVADVNQENQGGFSFDGGQVNGFSHMHDSGTGGGSSMGQFPLFPQSGCLDDTLNNCIWKKDDRNSDRDDSKLATGPGFFASALNTSILIESTVSNHSALYRFTFPDTPVPMKSGTSGDIPLSPLILADITDLPNSRQSGNITVDANSGRITGSGVFSPSFGTGQYTVHFCADFKGASIRQAGTFQNGQATTDQTSINTSNNEDSLGAFVQFNKPDSSDNVIYSRVGMSFISPDQACSNAEKEIDGDWDFDGIKSAAQEAWRQKLGAVSIDASGVEDSYQTIFWSGLYRTLISPQDYTGENPLWQSEEPYYDSYYCIWDSFRSVHPLITLIDPHSQTLMVRSLIDIYRNEGKLPDCRMSLCKGATQGGSNADVVLADAWVKGLSDGIDWATGFEAVVSDAEDQPDDWSVEGRGGLTSWKNLGYIPFMDDDTGDGLRTRSVSRTVEYAYDDFCIAEMATKLGTSDQVDTYTGRAGNWFNLYNKDQTSQVNGADSGFNGYLQPKFSNGSFSVADPAKCSPSDDMDACYLNSDGGETYEGSPWLYTFYAPHDMDKLIDTLGGDDQFVKRLQYLHDADGLLYFGDEQAFLNNVLFHYAGRPGLSTFYHHKYIPSQFNTNLDGIPGNDDSGAMGSYSTLAMMGVWPIPGQNVYVLTTPFFPEVSIKNPQTGNTATIKCTNFDASYSNIYIQSVKLNGEEYTKSWFDHSFWTEGGTLELELGDSESQWGSDVKDRPPGSWEAISALL